MQLPPGNRLYLLKHVRQSLPTCENFSSQLDASVLISQQESFLASSLEESQVSEVEGDPSNHIFDDEADAGAGSPLWSPHSLPWRLF